MPRIMGLERKQAPLSVRWAYNYLKKKFGKELTPVKVQARVPAVFWANTLMQLSLMKSNLVSPRLKVMVTARVAARIGCLF